MAKGIVAVHCGAGHHGTKSYREYNKLSQSACKAGIKILRSGGSALEAAKAAVVVLENHPLTNAGLGSSLTMEGDVEMDASIMDGKSLYYGGCGAVRRVKNPIELAYDICYKQSEDLPLGLVRPTLLVDSGALKYARTIGLSIVRNKSLISTKAMKQHKKYKGMLDKYERLQRRELLDTVGAVCLDGDGHVAAACSSGGLILKKPGRVGQAALYASGTWADSLYNKTEPSVAVCTTGCGEYLVQTQLAKEIATDLKQSESVMTELHNSMTEKFMNSRHLRNVKQKMGGALALHVNNSNEEVALLWGHSTQSMGIGFMTTTDDKPKGLMSVLGVDITPGTKVNTSGRYFF